MKRRILILLVLFLTTETATAQFGRQGRNSRLGRQQPQTPPNDNQKERMEKKNEERQAEYIDNFLSTLDADDFQKEIAKQTLEDYYVKVKAFLKIPYENSVKRKDAFEAFKREHFKELKTMLPENDIKRLDEFLSGKFQENEVKKKKKKRRKKNKDTEN